ncbi:MAG: GGDEF domain-containing protein, partial [Planctomycetes bacterium]|nr:GGDEF domain-containing protein [Planctomycetota bacterium]
MAANRMHALRRMATIDYLTGAYNRRYFTYFTDRMLLAVRSKRGRATLLVYDIDDFKHYNDKFGHAAGDEILRETARLMKQITRKGDLVARIGGDEFAVLFCDLGSTRTPGSEPLGTAYALADRFRRA